MAPSAGNGSVLKACRVLRAFTPTVGVLSVRQVAERAKIPRSTAHEVCQALVAEGLLESSPRGYQLGPLLLELGGQIIERTGLVRATEGILDRLVRVPEQEAHLGQLTHGWVVYLDRSSTVRSVPMFNRVGQRAPAHLTGCGKAALAWLPFDKVVAHVRKCCEEGTIPAPDLDGLEAELTLARRHGYIVSQVFQKDRVSVAAAIVDGFGRPLGGISLAGPTSTFSSSVVASAQRSVTDAAALISARIINGPPTWSLLHPPDPRPAAARGAL